MIANKKSHLGIMRELLVDCKSGAAIMEYAIVAPVFFLLFMGIIEMGVIFFTLSVVEGAASVGSRAGRTGYDGTQTGTGDRAAYIQSEIMRMTGGYLDPARLTITTLAYNSFENVGEPEPCITSLCAGGSPGIDYIDINGNNQWDADQGAAGYGAGSQIVLYKIEYLWPLITPMMANLIGDAQGDYHISAVATVKNEGFQ